MFKRFIEFLSEHAVSPDRVGQEKDPNGGVWYRNNAPVIFSREGESFTIGPDGFILNSKGGKVGKLREWADWHWLAMNIIRNEVESGQD